MTDPDARIIEAIARDLCLKAGLDPDELTYGPDSIVGVEQDGWPAWEYFWEEAERMWRQSGKDETFSP